MHKYLRLLTVIMSLCFAGSLNGCALLALGAAGVAGGYAVGSDGIEGILDKSYDRIWQVAQEVLDGQGAIEVADKERGKITAQIGGSHVKFSIEQATPHSVVVRVQARKFQRVFPDVDLARRLYSMIIKEA